MQRFGRLLIVAIVVSSTIAPSTSAAGEESARAFCDIQPERYYADAVAWAKSAGITSGVSSTDFVPDGTASRAQLVTLLHRYTTWRDDSAPDPGPPHSFADVGPGAYYEESVRWAASAGVTTGVSATRFDPDASTTRAQLAAFLFRLTDASATGPAPFDDVSDGRWYSDPVAWMAETGLTTGTGPRAFSPHMFATRAQVVTLLWRLAEEPAPGPFTAAPCPRTFTAVGDSVMGGTRVGAVLAGSTFPGWSGTIDARGCRQALETVSDSICGQGAILSTLTVIQQAATDGSLGEVVIIHVGTNGPLTADGLDQLIAAASTADTVWVINVRSPWSNQIVENQIITDAVDDWSASRDIRILDWFGLVAEIPTLVGTDGIHLSVEGRHAFTAMIGDALAAS